MSRFIKHHPCPKCGSKDNLGEYEDNYFCFGCGYFKLKTTVADLKAKLNKNNKENNVITPSNLTDNIPTIAKRWLLKYGITNSEIVKYGIKWDYNKNLLYLLITPEYWQARTFSDMHKSKYLSSGIKPLTIYGDGAKLVVVEDILSAIKISRLSPDWCALPLLGSSLSLEWLRSLSDRFSTVKLWLDRDKAKESVLMARKFSERGIASGVVITDKDPKEYSTDELWSNL